MILGREAFNAKDIFLQKKNIALQHHFGACREPPHFQNLVQHPVAQQRGQDPRQDIFGSLLVGWVQIGCASA